MADSSPFLIAKAHSHQAGAPNFQQITAMLNANKVTEVENILQNTNYGDIIVEARPSTDLSGFEIRLRQEYASLLHVYQRAAPNSIAKLLEAYSLTIEAENMNLILQAVIRGTVTPDLERIIIPVGKFGMSHYKRMMQSVRADVASDFIIYYPLRKAAQRALNMSDDPNDQIFYLSSFLSHTSFKQLYDIIPQWIKLEAEFLNLETVCRAINLGISPEQWMIPNNGIVRKSISIIGNMKTPKEVLNYMLPHFTVKEPIRVALEAPDELVVASLEDQVLAFLYRQHFKRFMIYGNRKESILDFFTVKRAEIEDIMRILFGKIKNVPTEQLRGMLYPIYRR